MFTREDWTLFRNLTTISQKAGVPQRRLRALALKELVDNALDVCGNVEIQKMGPNTYTISDTGSGIPGGAEDIAMLFSIARPLTSTKILRLPVRGALGNGLRVVAGIVLASGGSLKVTTRGVAYDLQPRDDGTTSVVGSAPATSTGASIEITFGPGLPPQIDDELYWANQAAHFKFAAQYNGKTSAWWYDSDSFYELLLAAGERTTDEVIGYFDGFGDDGEDPVGFRLGLSLSRVPGKLTRQQAAELLGAMRKVSSPVPPKRLGGVGKTNIKSYARDEGYLTVTAGRNGGLSAELPYVVECWAVPREDSDDDGIQVYANGTPIVGEMRIERRKAAAVAIFGCGMRHMIDGLSKKKCTVLLNLTTPYIPITTDGKEPDLARYLESIQKTMTKATKKLRGVIRRESTSGGNQTRVILRNIDEAVAKASGDGTYRYSLRQLFYAVRPFILESDLENKELDYNHFCRIIGTYESENGELEGMYRDPRGTLYHPHLRQSIPIGTLAVEGYQRPEWNFNKVLYCEKEGFPHLLQSVDWPERHDCALLSSKGFASRAVRDVIDLMGDTGEEVTFFCIHDADASGTLIYQALQEGTKARGSRKVQIINLGLEAWDALDMGLEVERFECKRKMPVADYVRDYYNSTPKYGDWADWYQGRRVELNAMTSPQFLEWLDEKIAPYSKGKVVPPSEVLDERFNDAVRSVVADRLTQQILTEAGFAHRLETEVHKAEKRAAGLNLEMAVGDDLAEHPQDAWVQSVRRLACEVDANGKI